MNYTDPNGTYGMIQVMALDYVFRLWTEMLGNKQQRPAMSEPKDVAMPQTAIYQTAAAPKACGC